MHTDRLAITLTQLLCNQEYATAERLLAHASDDFLPFEERVLLQADLAHLQKKRQESTDLLLHAASRYEKQERYGAAFASVEAATERDPKSVVAWRARIFYAQKLCVQTQAESYRALIAAVGDAHLSMNHALFCMTNALQSCRALWKSALAIIRNGGDAAFAQRLEQAFLRS